EGAGGDRKAPDRSRPKPKGNGARQPAAWIIETRGSRLQLGGVTGNRSSALCLSGRERISIVLLSFGGASWMVSGSVRGGENRDIPEGAAPAAAAAEAARQAPCPAWAEPD